MQKSRIKTSIIGFMLGAALLLSGCSSFRLAYNNAPQLSWWWLDGQFDFSREQSPRVKEALGGFFDWHRSTQLPGTVAFLAAAQQQAGEPLTPALACRWQAQAFDLLDPAKQRALTLAAEQSAALGEAQFKHLEQRQAKRMAEMREEFLRADPTARRAKTFERAVSNAERLYGPLSPAQTQVLREGLAASPFDPALWLQERQRRQRELLDTLRRLAAEKADGDQRLAALRAVTAHTEQSPNPIYRAYRLKLTDFNCGLVARLHNAATPAQQQKAREVLKGWEEDLRSLLAAPA